MERIHLYRGKRLDNGEFIEGSLTVDCHGNCCIYHPLNVPIGGGFQYFDIDPETVGQFTGMTDENGTKIFEGDIIKWIDSDGNNRIDKVLFSNGGFHLCNIYYNIGGYKGNSLEVIGNIHDNKELLE